MQNAEFGIRNSEFGMKLLRESCSTLTKRMRSLPQARACGVRNEPFAPLAIILSMLR